MNRLTLVTVVLLAVLAARPAEAQTAVPPLEVGFDAAVVVDPNRTSLARGPRLVLNFDGRNALELTATLQPLSEVNSFEHMETDSFLAAYKRVVLAAGGWRVFTTLGGGLERTVIFTPERVFPGVSPIVWPASTARLWEPAVTIGSGVDLRIGRHASVVIESSVVFAGSIAGRISAGLVVPVGAYPARPGSLSAAVPWRGLSEGDRAWVTRGGGQEVAGEVVRFSSTSLVLRTPAGVETFGPDDVAAIDTTDPIRNGTVRGAQIGAIGGAGQAVFVSLLLCAMEECGARELIGVNATLIGIGTGVGAAIGALADSLRERREPLYRRRGAADVTITPVLGKHSLGLGAVIRW